MGSIILVLIVILAGAAATFMIGQSKSNRQTDSGYMEQTGKKWARLSWIYIAGMLLVAAILLFVD
ncbi:hypothetical protein M3223_05720 [Paenibacillus pasadenensis]|uniref:hypothetical protein n=1 Tax=Paenibacillus pasadenensis TaxID=217090 RepID=UPI00204127BD|nr:hypothetical protein [Paenibacillus pasadenensis]MCM3746851.1 hypothetical protein [Paenibacillus pasadenensis]